MPFPVATTFSLRKVGIVPEATESSLLDRLCETGRGGGREASELVEALASIWLVIMSTIWPSLEPEKMSESGRGRADLGTLSDIGFLRVDGLLEARKWKSRHLALSREAASFPRRTTARSEECPFDDEAAAASSEPLSARVFRWKHERIKFRASGDEDLDACCLLWPLLARGLVAKVVIGR